MIGETVFEATYHLGCQAAPVNRGRQHYCGKVNRKKEKLNFRSVSTAEVILHEENAGTRQPHITVFKLSDSTKEFCERRSVRVARDTQWACH